VDQQPVTRAFVVCIVIAACGDNGSAVTPVDSPRPIDSQIADAAPDADLRPTTLAGTGLCVDPACATISPGIIEYTPNFPLWADTATKRRWVYLPPGTTIDTSDMNHWMFPQGFKIWKEFTRDGVRVETRIVAKIGPGNDLVDWFYMAYQWNAAEDDAVEVPNGVIHANGTLHDIPSVQDCRNCHEKLAPSRVLGFQAIQLDGAEIDSFTSMGWFTAPPTGTSPHFPLPGSTTEKAALGYLHANCGHCHNPLSTIINTPMHLRLDVDHMATTADTDTYKTAVDQTAALPFTDNSIMFTKIIIGGDPDHSAMIDRFSTTNSMFHMPEVGSEMTDPDALVTLRAWVTALP
jgi:hypothetical protein